MAKFRVDIKYNNGDTEFRIITTDSLTRDDIEYMIMCSSERWEDIEFCHVDYSEDYKQAELQAEIKAIIEQHIENAMSEKYCNPTKA